MSKDISFSAFREAVANKLFRHAQAESNAFVAFRDTVNKMLKCLSPRERMVVSLRFGLSDGNALSQEKTGKAIHLSRWKVRQLEASARAKLALRLATI